MNFESGSVATVQRLTGFWLVAAIFVGTFTVAVPQFDNAAVAFAQEADADGDAAAAAPADGDKANEDNKKQEPKSALGWLIEALGDLPVRFLADFCRAGFADDHELFGSKKVCRLSAGFD